MLPKLNTFWYYARVELTPPKPTDIPEIKNGIQKLISGYKRKAWKQTPVKVSFTHVLPANFLFNCVYFIKVHCSYGV